MEFCEISEEEYRGFWKGNEQRNFLSSADILRLSNFDKKFFFAAKKEGKVVMAALVRGIRRKFGVFDFYVPMGPIGDYKDFATLDFFLKSLKRRLLRERGFRLRIDPNIEKIERDVDGNVVSGGRNNENIVRHLMEIGFARRPYVEGISQVTWQFVMPLRKSKTGADFVCSEKGKCEAKGGTDFVCSKKGKCEVSDGEFLSDEEILAGMKGNTRRRLKQALELGMKVRYLKREELPEFVKIMKDTAERKSFEARDEEYFYKMYDAFGSDIAFVSVTINPAETYKKLLKKKEEIEKFQGGTIRERQDNEDAKRSIETRIGRFEEIFSRSDLTLSDGKTLLKEITLCSGMFMLGQDEIIHLFGGNDSRYLKLDAQYVLQWEMIRKARDEGYSRYNFYGIPENVNEHPEGYSLYEFKRGFGGVVWERIGEYATKLIGR